MSSDVIDENPTRQDVSKMAKGRVLASVIPDVVNTRNLDKLPNKADTIAAVANNVKIINKRFSILDKARQHLVNHLNRDFSPPKVKIPNLFPYICVFIDGMPVEHYRN